MNHETLKAIDRGMLPDLVGYHLRMAQVIVFRDFDRALAGLDITPAIFGVLEVLRHNKGLTQSRLAEMIGLDRSSLVPLLDKLQKRNLVARQASLKDRRSNHLMLTAEGERLVSEAGERVRVHEQRVLASFSKAEVRQLLALLTKIDGGDAGG